MVLIVPGLWLCPHAAYGRLVDLKGAIEDGRRLMDSAGGYQKLRDDLDLQERKRAEERAQSNKAISSRRRGLMREA